VPDFFERSGTKEVVEAAGVEDANTIRKGCGL